MGQRGGGPIIEFVPSGPVDFCSRRSTQTPKKAGGHKIQAWVWAGAQLSALASHDWPRFGEALVTAKIEFLANFGPPHGRWNVLSDDPAGMNGTAMAKAVT